MSCNGCRVLRKGCSEQCILRPCLEWIQSPQAQGNATLFVSKFFGRSDLMSFISAVPQTKRPALFQSLLVEACGRTVNPVNGAVGLLSTGNWHICQTAVDTVLAGGALRPMSTPLKTDDEPSEAIGWRRSGNTSEKHNAVVMHGFIGEYGAASIGGNCMENTASFGSGLSEDSPEFGGGEMGGVGRKEPKLLNLFA